MTHYDVLGVSKSATQEEIRKAYIKLIKRYHPDLYYGDKKYAEKRTQEINNAYDILSDENARKKYDEEINVNTPPPSYAYTEPNYSDKARARNIYEEVLKNYRKRYNDYFDSRNNASNSYGNYQSGAARKKQKKVYSYKGYEKINELCEEWDIGAGLKVAIIISIILLMAIFIILNSYVKTSLFSTTNTEKHQAIIPKTEEKIETDAQMNEVYKKIIESEFCQIYDKFKDGYNLKDAEDVLDLVTEDVLEDIYDSYYSDMYTYDEFCNHIKDMLNQYIDNSKSLLPKAWKKNGE